MQAHIDDRPTEHTSLQRVGILLVISWLLTTIYLPRGFTVFTWLISFHRVISIIVILRLKLKKMEPFIGWNLYAKKSRPASLKLQVFNIKIFSADECNDDLQIRPANGIPDGWGPLMMGSSQGKVQSCRSNWTAHSWDNPADLSESIFEVLSNKQQCS